MTENNCDLSKYRLFIKHLEKNPNLEAVIVVTACICVIMTLYFCGQGFKEGTKILTEKIIIKYENS